MWARLHRVLLDWLGRANAIDSSRCSFDNPAFKQELRRSLDAELEGRERKLFGLSGSVGTETAEAAATEAAAIKGRESTP